MYSPSTYTFAHPGSEYMVTLPFSASLVSVGGCKVSSIFFSSMSSLIWSLPTSISVVYGSYPSFVISIVYFPSLNKRLFVPSGYSSSLTLSPYIPCGLTFKFTGVFLGSAKDKSISADLFSVTSTSVI